MVTRHNLSWYAGEELMMHLIDTIGAGCFDPHERGPVAVVISLRENRVIEGTYHRCEEKKVDVLERNCDFIMDGEALRPFIARLLADGTPFVTETGSHDEVCTLRWTIRD